MPPYYRWCYHTSVSFESEITIIWREAITKESLQLFHWPTTSPIGVIPLMTHLTNWAVIKLARNAFWRDAITHLIHYTITRKLYKTFYTEWIKFCWMIQKVPGLIFYIWVEDNIKSEYKLISVKTYHSLICTYSIWNCIFVVMCTLAAFCLLKLETCI